MTLCEAVAESAAAARKAAVCGRAGKPVLPLALFAWCGRVGWYPGMKVEKSSFFMRRFPIVMVSLSLGA